MSVFASSPLVARDLRGSQRACPRDRTKTTCSPSTFSNTSCCINQNSNVPFCHSRDDYGFCCTIDNMCHSDVDNAAVDVCSQPDSVSCAKAFSGPQFTQPTCCPSGTTCGDNKAPNGLPDGVARCFLRSEFLPTKAGFGPASTSSSSLPASSSSSQTSSQTSTQSSTSVSTQTSTETSTQLQTPSAAPSQSQSQSIATANTTDSQPTSQPSHLSPGATAGIAIGAVGALALLLAVAALILVLARRRRSTTITTTSSTTNPRPDGPYADTARFASAPWLATDTQHSAASSATSLPRPAPSASGIAYSDTHSHSHAHAYAHAPYASAASLSRSSTARTASSSHSLRSARSARSAMREVPPAVPPGTAPLVEACASQVVHEADDGALTKAQTVARLRAAEDAEVLDLGVGVGDRRESLRHREVDPRLLGLF